MQSYTSYIYSSYEKWLYLIIQCGDMNAFDFVHIRTYKSMCPGDDLPNLEVDL